MSKQSAAPAAALKPHKPLGTRILQSWQLYVLLLIPVALTIIYKSMLKDSCGMEQLLEVYQAAADRYGK